MRLFTGNEYIKELLQENFLKCQNQLLLLYQVLQLVLQLEEAALQLVLLLLDSVQEAAALQLVLLLLDSVQEAALQLVLPALERQPIGLERLDARGVEGDLEAVVRDDIGELLAQSGHAHARRDLGDEARGELRRILASVVEHPAQKLAVTDRVADEFGPELAVVRLDKLDRAPRVAPSKKAVSAETAHRVARRRRAPPFALSATSPFSLPKCVSRPASPSNAAR